MTAVITYVLYALSFALTLPVALLALEITAGCARRSTTSFMDHTAVRRRTAVLIPAHNEGVGVVPTIEDVKAQLRPEDRVLVVADNCTDDTAIIARAAGAEVVVRDDPSKIGKGYALDWGVRHLAVDAPDVVIVIDADCNLTNDAICHLSVICLANNRPVQALYLMSAPEQSSVNYQVSEFAWRLKNWVRPLGMRRLGWPCQLMGTGMAFPWPLLRDANLASGQIVEDLQLGLDLAAGGHPPLFTPTATVTSNFPMSPEASRSQRQRWEQGHIQTIVTSAGAYLVRAVAGWNPALLVLTLDMAIPPVAILGLLVSTTVVVTGLGVLLGASFGPFVLALIALALLVTCLTLAWFSFGRDILPARELVLIIPYVLSKISLHRRLLTSGFVTHWIRTDRKGPRIKR